MTKISVIIPVYNAGRFLSATIDSVLTQTMVDLECVMVDDGSKDDSFEIMDHYANSESRIRLVRQENAGPAAARNRGMIESNPHSEYVAFLDADDVWEANALVTLSRTLDAHPDAVGAHGISRYINEAGERIRVNELEHWMRHRRGLKNGHLVEWPLHEPTTLDNLVFEGYLSPPGQTLIRKRFLNVVGGFDHSAAPSEDLDMWLRLATHGDFAFNSTIVLNYRIHSANISGNKEIVRKTQLYVLRKFILAGDTTPTQRRLAVRGYRCYERHIGSVRLGWAKQSFAQRQFKDGMKQTRHALLNYARSIRSVPTPA